MTWPQIDAISEAHEPPAPREFSQWLIARAYSVAKDRRWLARSIQQREEYLTLLCEHLRDFYIERARRLGVCIVAGCDTDAAGSANSTYCATHGADEITAREQPYGFSDEGTDHEQRQREFTDDDGYSVIVQEPEWRTTLLGDAGHNMETGAISARFGA